MREKKHECVFRFVENVRILADFSLTVDECECNIIVISQQS